MASSRSRQQVEEDKKKVGSYIQRRLQGELVEHGDQAKLAAEIGFTSSALNQAKKSAKAGDDLAKALAKHWRVTYDQLVLLARGQDLPAQSPASDNDAQSPLPPSVHSGTRSVDWFPDEVENLALDAVAMARTPDGQKYSIEQVRPAKVFLRDLKHELKEGVTRADVMADALEASFSILKAGGDPTFDAIFAWMLAQKKIRVDRPRTASTAVEQLLAQADEQNQRDGVVAEPAPVKPSPRASGKRGR